MKSHHALTSAFALLCLTTTGAVSQPFLTNKTTAAPNTAYTYTTNTAGGTGSQDFQVPSPPDGFYYASFVAAFTPLGSKASPESFSCLLVNKQGIVAQSTALSNSKLGWNIGVSAGGFVQMKSKAPLSVSCGPNDDIAWKWARLPVTVTLVSLDAHVAGKLTTVVDAGVRPSEPSASQSLGRTR
jgi:hypothetical protein